MSFKLDNIKIEGTIGNQDIIRSYIIQEEILARCREYCMCENVCRYEHGRDPCPRNECATYCDGDDWQCPSDFPD